MSEDGIKCTNYKTYSSSIHDNSAVFNPGQCMIGSAPDRDMRKHSISFNNTDNQASADHVM